MARGFISLFMIVLQIFTYGQGFHQSVHDSVKNSRYLPMARGFISLFMIVLNYRYLPMAGGFISLFMIVLRIPDIYLWPGVSSVCS
jgi:hypothetical protein